MTPKEARAYLASIGYVPGRNATSEPKFRDERTRALIKKACAAIKVADLAAAGEPELDPNDPTPPTPGTITDPEGYGAAKADGEITEVPPEELEPEPAEPAAQ